MDQVLISALTTGTTASALTALIGGVFSHRIKKGDTAIAGRGLDLQSARQSFDDLHALYETLKDAYEIARGDLADAEKTLQSERTVAAARLASLRVMAVYWLHAATEVRPLTDFPDRPAHEDLALLYEALSIRASLHPYPAVEPHPKPPTP